MAYLLDANVFIEAKNRHYSFDFCPAFWDWLDQSGRSGGVLSVEQVGDELRAGTDELAAWVVTKGHEYFLPLDAAVTAALPAVSGWAMGQGYEPAAVNAFLSDADYWLVAFALAHGHTLVTHEIASASRKKIKIPDACLGLGVRFSNPYQMLRNERARFVLGPTPP